MGVTTRDIYGGAEDEPAAPGTYGLPPAGFRLPGETALGEVRLQVGDLERSLEFYRATLGLDLLDREGTAARLGAGGRLLVELHEKRGARPAPSRGRLGLFHVAILLPTRAALGRFVRHLGEVGARAGAGDHLVSEAFYLQDPDNLGIEVYADRPRETWRRVGRELKMATDPVDVGDLLRAAGDERWSGMPAGTRVGHVHLHVGSLELAAAFYGEAVGFDRTGWHYPGALFLAAGGYHHHLGTNLWAGPGATAPATDEARLIEWTLELPDAESLDAVAASLERAGRPAGPAGAAGEDGLARVARDPWGTQLRLRVGRSV